CQHSHGSPITF
nr:immunoglobulin light chain junction region [Macaca mulatta]MOV77813.1 immunoglobulin light chain junction region [Macaca mulatta]MOV77956.1 immunoglobulin light chain junction region [Macaca mulatta]MOV78089.1 immunoglobulin light chain junction region [Macaca mulatta]MOV79397.1 immunoglobulin light chain junction region [Macaca mulatta]